MPENETRHLDTKLEGVVVVYRESKVVAFLVKERESGRTVFFKPVLMKQDEVAGLINPDHNNV